MKEIFIDINDYNKSFITATENDNNSDIYKIIITEDARRFDLTGKTVQMAYAISYTDKGDILNLNVTNPTEGEITLEITNELTRKDGDYTCQLLILGENEYRRHSKYYFNLSIRENLFNKISGEIIESPNLGILQELIKKAEFLNTQLENNSNLAETLNTNLNENISVADPLNNSLSEKIPEAATKKTELENSINKAKEFIDGLDGSQDIPGIRMELTELQNGLKSNQSLEYSGSSITANDTLEGRTEGMRIGGRTLNNLIGAPYTYNMNTPSTRIFRTTLTQGKMTKGDYTLIFKTKFNKDTDGTSGLRIYYDIDSNTSGGYRTVSKVNGINVVKINIPTDIISFLFYIESPDVNNGLSCEISDLMILEGDHEYMNFFEGMKSVGEAEQEGDKYKISILSHNKNFFNINEFSEKINEKGELEFKADGNSRINSYVVIFTENNTNSQRIAVLGGIGERAFTTLNQEEYYIHIGLNGDKKDDKLFRKIVLPKNTTCCISIFSTTENNNTVKFKDVQIEVGTSKTQYEPYKCDKKDILISAPLPGFDFGEDIMYEENGKVKITRNIDTYTFTGDETMRDTTEQDEKSGTGKYKVFVLTINKTIDKNKNINNNFPKKQFSVAFQKVDSEGLAITQYGVYIKILKSKLSTQDAEGLKAWLKANTTTIYFARATPVTEIVENCVDIDLDTYQEKTYFNILNSLPGTLDFRVPSNLGSVVQNMAKEINDIWDVINNLLVPGLMDTKKTLALKTIKNNLK